MSEGVEEGDRMAYADTSPRDEIARCVSIVERYEGNEKADEV